MRNAKARRTVSPGSQYVSVMTAAPHTEAGRHQVLLRREEAPRAEPAIKEWKVLLSSVLGIREEIAFLERFFFGVGIL